MTGKRARGNAKVGPGAEAFPTAPRTAGDFGRRNVCIVTPYPISMLSGISQFVKDLARALRAERVKVTGWCPGPASDPPDGVVYGLPIRGHMFRDLELAAKTTKRILSAHGSIDIVHAQQFHAQSAAALFAARLLGRA